MLDLMIAQERQREYERQAEAVRQRLRADAEAPTHNVATMALAQMGRWMQTTGATLERRAHHNAAPQTR